MNAAAAAPITVGVWIELAGESVSVGNAYVTTSRGTTSTAFSYHDQYLQRRDAIAISPELSLTTGGGHTEGLPGAMSDSAPDRWGRNLIKKQHQATQRSNRAATTITELDYLLGVSDLTRQGALRYTSSDDTFERSADDVPPLIELPRLLAAANSVARNGSNGSNYDAVKTLLAAGTGSLGGARPKASVRDGDTLHIAKFGHHHDEWDVMAWEMVALDIAASCGIPAPTRQLVSVSGQRVLLLERFDRVGGRRVPYISAMTLVGGRDGGQYDYLEVAESLTSHGSAVQSDLTGLWTRMALSVMLHNTDDHLRNHGFLWDRGGWTLSPVFDVNINPDPSAERITSIGYVSKPDGAIEALMDVAPNFQVAPHQADGLLTMIAERVGGWRSVAAKHGVAPSEIEVFAPVLDRH